MNLTVHFLPPLADPEQLAGATVVVVDVLRATTTMLFALQSGAVAVIPCLEVEDARRYAAATGGEVVLGGERGGTRIAGFDLGNSPSEYTPQAIAGKTIVMTTTNGTRAMESCRTAARVLLGGFVNISLVVAELARVENAAIVCAGTNGHVTREDVLFAGAAVSELGGTMRRQFEVNDEAQLAVDAWRSAVGSRDRPAALIDAMKRSRGGLNLLRLGCEADIVFAAQFDAVPVIGELMPSEWRVEARPREG